MHARAPIGCILAGIKYKDRAMIANTASAKQKHDHDARLQTCTACEPVSPVRQQGAEMSAAAQRALISQQQPEMSAAAQQVLISQKKPKMSAAAPQLSTEGCWLRRRSYSGFRH